MREVSNLEMLGWRVKYALEQRFPNPVVGTIFVEEEREQITGEVVGKRRYNFDVGEFVEGLCYEHGKEWDNRAVSDGINNLRIIMHPCQLSVHKQSKYKADISIEVPDSGDVYGKNIPPNKRFREFKEKLNS